MIVRAVVTTLLAASACSSVAASEKPFDGRPWNVSTGNLSVAFIRQSPIGAGAVPGYVMEPPPSVEAMAKMKAEGLIAYEDYVAWGAVERKPDDWQWQQHIAVASAVKRAGLDYVVYVWAHFPPAWLRERAAGGGNELTLMKSLNTGKECNFFSIFDPKTIEHYDHFYKNLAARMGDKIDGVYACVLGPYGEGNYPLYVPDWVNVGPSHEGYWAGDRFALIAFRDAMKSKYGDDLKALNNAWGTTHATWDDVTPPKEIGEPFKPNPVPIDTKENRRRWLDFITWYHQALIDFAEKSVKVTLKYFPKEKVRTKPGGNAGGVNPIAWGTYCPGFAKMAGKYGITMQPADCHGAYFGDKWVGTSYQFYGVPLATEPASLLDEKAFTRRMFSDASAGAAQHFTYEFDRHAANIRKYIHLYTGKPGDTEIAVLCPTTLYRLGGDLRPTISWSNQLRDLSDFDVLDELLVLDGALRNDRYKVLVLFQADFIDQPVLDKIDSFIAGGGTVLVAGRTVPRNVDGQPWRQQKVAYRRGATLAHFKKLADANKFRGYDGLADGVWTTRRGTQLIMLNTTAKAVVAQDVEIPAHEIATKNLP